MIERTDPWLTEQSIIVIKNHLNGISNPKILEFGSGYSTIWFCKNYNCEITSVEHSAPWYEYVRNVLKEYHPNLILRESDVVEKDSDLLIESYAIIADQFSDEYFDLILIDGRNRVDCFNRSERTLKKGGLMVLDNSERSEYRQIFEKYNDKIHAN